MNTYVSFLVMPNSLDVNNYGNSFKVSVSMLLKWFVFEPTDGFKSFVYWF